MSKKIVLASGESFPLNLGANLVRYSKGLVLVTFSGPRKVGNYSLIRHVTGKIYVFDKQKSIETGILQVKGILRPLLVPKGNDEYDYAGLHIQKIGNSLYSTVYPSAGDKIAIYNFSDLWYDPIGEPDPSGIEGPEDSKNLPTSVYDLAGKIEPQAGAHISFLDSRGNLYFGYGNALYVFSDPPILIGYAGEFLDGEEIPDNINGPAPALKKKYFTSGSIEGMINAGVVLNSNVGYIVGKENTSANCLQLWSSSFPLCNINLPEIVHRIKFGSALLTKEKLHYNVMFPNKSSISSRLWQICTAQRTSGLRSKDVEASCQTVTGFLDELYNLVISSDWENYGSWYTMSSDSCAYFLGGVARGNMGYRGVGGFYIQRKFKIRVSPSSIRNNLDYPILEIKHQVKFPLYFDRCYNSYTITYYGNASCFDKNYVREITLNPGGPFSYLTTKYFLIGDAPEITQLCYSDYSQKGFDSECGIIEDSVCYTGPAYLGGAISRTFGVGFKPIAIIEIIRQNWNEIRYNNNNIQRIDLTEWGEFDDVSD